MALIPYLYRRLLWLGVPADVAAAVADSEFDGSVDTGGGSGFTYVTNDEPDHVGLSLNDTWLDMSGAPVIRKWIGTDWLPYKESVDDLSIFTTQIPVFDPASDTVAGALGTRWWSDIDGRVTHVRYWKSAVPAGFRSVRLYNYDTEEELASITVTGETPDGGWHVMPLPMPVDITADQNYVTAVYWSGGRYSYTSDLLASELSNGVLHADQGLFIHGDVNIGMPTSVFDGGGCFFSDVVFVSS